MTSRELVIRTLNHQPVPRVPRDVWVLPATESAQRDDVEEIGVRYPSDIARTDFQFPSMGKRGHGKPRDGRFVDAWGCIWEATPSAAWEAKDPPLAETAKIANFKPPTEILDAQKFAQAARSVDAASRFILAHSDVRPFERLQALRGTKTATVDLARGTKDVRRLLEMVHDFNRKELELWAATEADGVIIGDHWGTDDSLIVAPAMWREIFKPLYRDYAQILHAKDKFVFFRSGGNIADIFSDLVKIEVDAVHSDWGTMNLERLAKRFRGRITFWGGIEREEALAQSPTATRESASRVRKALDLGAGGVIAQCTWRPGVPIQPISAFCDQWLVPMPMHAG
ncbi:MAG: uroporphyrinogen decarboxylase family protein [Planctomycetota bacterium]